MYMKELLAASSSRVVALGKVIMLQAVSCSEIISYSPPSVLRTLQMHPWGLRETRKAEEGGSKIQQGGVCGLWVPI